MSGHSSPKNAEGREIEIIITKPGKLGIEFRQTASPYIVIRVSDEARASLDVLPGDLLIEVQKDGDISWTKAEGLSWVNLVEVLKHRPARGRFMRFDSSSPKSAAPVPVDLPLNIPLNSPVVSVPKPLDVSPLHQTASPKELFSPSHLPRPKEVAVTSPKRAPPSPSSVHSVVYSVEGPLGLEFEDLDFPFKVGGVKPNSMSAEKGVCKGDSLLSINGKSTVGLTWEEIRTELSVRPSIVLFKRVAAPASSSIWNLASGFVSDHQEVEHLKQIIASIGGEDLEALKLAATEGERFRLKLVESERERATLVSEKTCILSTIEEERVKNSKLVDVISEIEKGEQELVARFEKEIYQRDLKIRALQDTQQQPEVDTLEIRPEDAELRKLLEVVEADNSKLRLEVAELGTMVSKCLAKIEHDLADKPHWVDRRIACSAIATLLREMDTIDKLGDDDEDAAGKFAAAHASARQRMGDVLGLTFEERTAMGLLNVPKHSSSVETKSISSAFVDFLHNETA